MIFDNTSLSKAIATQLAASNVPADHRHAFVLVATTSGGVQGVLTTKVNNIWAVDATFSVAKGKAIEGGVQVKATW
jgi:hypothetical protein